MAVNNFSALPMTLDEGENLESFGMLNATIIIVIAVLVNISNFITLLVVRSYKYVFNPNILIGGIALVNYVSTLSLCPLIAYAYLASGPLPSIVCELFDAMWAFYQLLSTSIVTLMVLDRYIAIRKPILYRTRLSGAFMKYIMVCALLTSIPLCFTPIIVKILADDNVVELEREGSRTKYCIGLHNQYYRVHRILILAVNCAHLPLGLFCYIGFLLGVRNFVNRWLVRFSNQNPSSVEPSDVEAFLCWCRCVKKQPQKSLSKEQLVERTLHLMKSLHVKRCTRISKTIAVAAGIYYIPWLFSQSSIFYELITGSYLPILDYVIIRVVLASSILNPLVYVTFSKTYRYGYQRVLAKPFRLCGYEWRSRKPLGLSGSDMQRISHRMALEEWESPGLVRRQYSKRRTKRKISRMHHVYTVSEDNGNSSIESRHEKEGAGKQNRYRKNTSTDTSTGTGMATNASVKRKVRCRRNTGQGNGVQAKNPLTNGDQNPTLVQKMDSRTSAPGLANVENGSAVFSQNFWSLDASRQTVHEERQSASCEVYPRECPNAPPTGNSHGDAHLRSKDLLPDPKTYLPKTLQTLAASAVESALCPTQEHTRTVDEESFPERAGGDSISLFCSSREVGGSKASVQKPFELSNKADAQGHVCIHLEVIEFVNRHEMKHKNASLVSTIQKCQLRDKSAKTTDDGQPGPSFVFSLRENRFVPERINQANVDTYACQYGEDATSPSISAPLKITSMPSFGENSDLPLSEAKQDCSPNSARTTKHQHKRTSEILRESSRYSDDIVMLNDLILKDRLQEARKEHNGRIGS